MKKLLVLALLLCSSPLAAQTEPVSAPVLLKDGSYVGEIRAFAGQMVPEGWIICDGRQLPIVSGKTDVLAKVIGTLWGSTEVNHFRVPDLRGMFLRGWNQGAGVDLDVATRRLPPGAPGAGGGGATDRVGSSQQDAMTNHKHDDAGHAHTAVYAQDFSCGKGCGALVGQGPGSTVSPNAAQIGGPLPFGGSTPNIGSENHPKNVYVLFAIRNQGPLPKDFGSTVPPNR